MHLAKVTDFLFVKSLDDSHGDLAGKAAIIPLDSGHHKNVKLTLANPSFRRAVDCKGNMIVENPKDPWSTYKLVMEYRRVAHPPGWKGLFFLREAPAKVIATRTDGSTHRAWTDLVPDMSKTKINPLTGMRPGGKLGENFAARNTKELAKRCGFEGTGNFTGRSARRTGITTVANSGVPQPLATNYGRHKGEKINFEYQEVTDHSKQRAVTAHWYMPSDDEEETKKGTLLSD